MTRPTTHGLARALVSLTRTGLERLTRDRRPPPATEPPPPPPRPDIAPALWR